MALREVVGVGLLFVRHASVVVTFEFAVMFVMIDSAIFDCLFAEAVAFAFGPPSVALVE
jgi:hypothetical protein